MQTPGEVPHLIGQAYTAVLSGCLELAVSEFERYFDARTAPSKLVIADGRESSFSFDVRGIFRPSYEQHREVWIESKGYRSGRKLVSEFKQFLAKAYVTSVSYSQYRDDYFWFVTNVPFGSSYGIELASESFIKEALNDESQKAVLGTLVVDNGHVRALSERISVAIFPDSFIRRMGILYHVAPGENLFDIMSYVHAYANFASFEPQAAKIASRNRLKNVDHVEENQVLWVPWHGMPWSEVESEPQDSRNAVDEDGEAEATFSGPLAGKGN